MSADKSRLWLLDFDRCLGDVDELVDDLFRVATAKSGQIKNWREAEDKYKNGLLVDFLDHVREGAGKEGWQKLLDIFGERAEIDSGEGVRETGVSEFLNWLEERHEAFAILSYGQSDWQRAKIKRAGLSGLPYQIVSTPKKAKLIADWYDPGERVYIRPDMKGDEGLGKKYDEVIIVDDKLRAFDGLPEACRAYLVNKSKLISGNTAIIRVDKISDITRHET